MDEDEVYVGLGEIDGSEDVGASEMDAYTDGYLDFISNRDPGDETDGP